jgi:hypothetical protein
MDFALRTVFLATSYCLSLSLFRISSLSFKMLSLVLICISSLVSGAAIERRDPVPAGYVAPPYYPCRFLEQMRSSNITNLHIAVLTIT